MTLLADVCAIVEDHDAAARLHALLAPYEDLYTVAPVEATFGSVARALGVVASVLERFDVAERHFASAIETDAPHRGGRESRPQGEGAQVTGYPSTGRYA